MSDELREELIAACEQALNTIIGSCAVDPDAGTVGRAEIAKAKFMLRRALSRADCEAGGPVSLTDEELGV